MPRVRRTTTGSAPSIRKPGSVQVLWHDLYMQGPQHVPADCLGRAGGIGPWLRVVISECRLSVCVCARGCVVLVGIVVLESRE